MARRARHKRKGIKTKKQKIPKTPTCTRLTSGQKQALCNHHRSHPRKTLAELCKWARSVLELQQPPALSTLRVLFDSPEPIGAINPASETQYRVTCPPLETALVYWITACERMQMLLVNTATIRAE